jgi:hypothetical protein
MFTVLSLAIALGVPLDMFTGSALRLALHFLGVLRVNRCDPIEVQTDRSLQLARATTS